MIVVKQQIRIRGNVESAAIWAPHRLRSVPLIARHVQPAPLPLPHSEHSLGPALDEIHAGLEGKWRIAIGSVRLARGPTGRDPRPIRVLDVERHVGSVAARRSNWWAAPGGLDFDDHLFRMGERDYDS